MEASFQSLLADSHPKDSTRLLAAKRKESGVWLTAPSLSSIGVRMDNETIRLAIGLRLSTALSVQHNCQHCGQTVDVSGTHGLGCRQSEGRLPRHSALNDALHQSLSAIQIPSMLEPKGLFHSDGRKPDGITITPWCHGRALVWDATCHDSFAASNLALGSTRAVAVANKAAVASAVCTVSCARPITSSQWRSSPQVFLGRMLLRFSKIRVNTLGCTLVTHFPT